MIDRSERIVISSSYSLSAQTYRGSPTTHGTVRFAGFPVTPNSDHSALEASRGNHASMVSRPPHLSGPALSDLRLEMALGEKKFCLLTPD